MYHIKLTRVSSRYFGLAAEDETSVCGGGGFSSLTLFLVVVSSTVGGGGVGACATVTRESSAPFPDCKHGSLSVSVNSWSHRYVFQSAWCQAVYYLLPSSSEGGAEPSAHLLCLWLASVPPYKRSCLLNGMVGLVNTISCKSDEEIRERRYKCIHINREQQNEGVNQGNNSN